MRPIDVHHLGHERVICCWQVGDVLVDPGPEASLPALLDALGGERPRALLLTHIHLDHAGASGALVRRWPDLEVHVHERGAPHLVDPEKLIASATRLYGDDMERLWGEIVPVPEANLRVVRGDGEARIDLEGGFRVAYTPGHASHHVAYLHEASGRAFVGDTGGVRIPPSELTFAPTPPPDIDLEAWLASIDLIQGWRPTSLGITHFGAVDDVDGHLGRVRERLASWAALARDLDMESWMARMDGEITAVNDDVTAAAYRQAAPLDQQWKGLDRYWRKRAAS